MSIPKGLVSLFCFLFVAPLGLHAEDRSFDSNGVKIHYVVEGKGEPVLLIHGFTANINMQWRLPGVIQALTKDYQIIALDNRGHGRSGKPHDPKQYGMEMVEDQVRLLDHLKIKKAHVVGYSMGAMITAKLLTTHPDRLLSATLGGAAGLRDGADMSFFNLLADSLEQGKGFRPLILGLTPAGRPRPSDDQIEKINLALAAANDTKALAAVVRSWKDLTVSDEKLKANRLPALAIVGDLDPLKKGVDDLKDRLAGVQIVVLENSDHMTAFAKPDFVKELKAFLVKSGNGKAEQGR